MALSEGAFGPLSSSSQRWPQHFTGDVKWFCPLGWLENKRSEVSQTEAAVSSAGLAHGEAGLGVAKDHRPSSCCLRAGGQDCEEEWDRRRRRGSVCCQAQRHCHHSSSSGAGNGDPP